MSEESVIRPQHHTDLVFLSILSVVLGSLYSCSKRDYLFSEQDDFPIDTMTVVVRPDEDLHSPAKISISQYSVLDFRHQSAASFGDYAFFINNGRSAICMYDLFKKEKVFITSTKGGNGTSYHCNQSTFGVERFDTSDPFPLLYISQRYKSDKRCFIEVFRIVPGDNEDESGYPSFQMELVQEIYLPPMSKDNSLGNANCVIDPESGWLYTYSRNNDSNDANFEQCKISRFKLPNAFERVIVFEDSDIESSFMIDAKAVNMQGGCIHGHLLFIGQGFPSAGYIYLNVVDLQKEELIDRIDLKEYGVDWEPEGCFFYDGSVMLSHTEAISRIDLK